MVQEERHKLCAAREQTSSGSGGNDDLSLNSDCQLDMSHPISGAGSRDVSLEDGHISLEDGHISLEDGHISLEDGHISLEDDHQRSIINHEATGASRSYGDSSFEEISQATAIDVRPSSVGMQTPPPSTGKSKKHCNLEKPLSNKNP